MWHELLGRIGTFAATPEEVCHAEVVCSSWCASFRGEYEEEVMWSRLCMLWYPTMTSRLLADVTAGTTASNGASCPSSASLSASSPPFGPANMGSLCVSFAGGCGLGPTPWGLSDLMLPTSSGSRVSSPVAIPSKTSTDWMLSEIPPIEGLPESATAEQVQGLPDKGSPGNVPIARQDWRALFQRRFLRQRKWDMDKWRQKRPPGKPQLDNAGDTKALGDGKFHPSGRAKVTRGRENGRERMHLPRLRLCKRCGVDFDPHQRDDACRWHSGRYAPVQEEAASSGAVALPRDVERRAQSIIKAHNRKKGSKRPNMIVFDVPCQTGVAHIGATTLCWSCCGAENLIAQGCSSGPHS